jgi:glutamate transport system permease protein
MTDTGALRFADPLGPRGRNRVAISTVAAAVAVGLVLAVAIRRFADRGQLDWSMWEPFFTMEAVNAYGTALIYTLRAAAAAMVASSAVGLVLALGRLSPIVAVRAAVTTWVEFFRGIPLALLLIFLFFGLPRLGLDVGNYWFLVMALTLYNSAVISEIVRAGVLSLDRGQTEAALAVGLTEGATLRLVVLPQALRRMIPALVSQVVVILKDTSLGVLISYEELLRRSQLIGASESKPLQSLTFCALIYLVVNLALSLAARRLERRQGRVRRVARSSKIRVRGVEDLTV